MTAAAHVAGSALERVVGALEARGFGPVVRGMARCPAHEDRSPSLHVEEREGKALVCCFAGCESARIVEALGLELRDLFDAPRVAGPAKGPKRNGNATPQRVAFYEYHDAHGELLARKVRLEPGLGGRAKSFVWELPDGRGGWRKAEEGEGNPGVLYRLPEIREAELVVLGEGEKAADVLVAAGLAATCPPTPRWTPELAEPLRGRDVVIFADRDRNGTGAAKARTAHAALRGVARSVRIVEAAVDIEGADAFDHFSAGLTLEQARPVDLAALAGDPEEQPAARDELAERFTDEATSIASWWTPEGELVEPPARAYVVENLVPDAVPALLLARGGTGKGFFQVAMATSVATGTALGRFAVRKPRGVVIVAREDDRGEMQRRLAATLRSRFPGGVPDETRYDLIQNLRVVDLFGVAEARLGGDLVDGITRVTDRLADPGLVFLDPLGKLLPEDETGARTLNSQEGAGLVHTWLDRIVHRTGCAVFAVHHVNKAALRGDGQPSAGSATGSQLLEDLARFVLALVAVRAEDAAKYGAPWHPGGYVEAALLKANYSPGLAAPFLLRRERGGALVPVDAAAPMDVEAERALRVLEGAGRALDRDEWRKACGELDPPLGKHRADEARTNLLRRGLVVRVMEGGRQAFAPSDTAASRDRSRLGGALS